MISQIDIFRFRCQPFYFLLFTKFPDKLRLPYEEMCILDTIATCLLKYLETKRFTVGKKR